MSENPWPRTSDPLRIRVVVVDDHPVYREGLIHAISARSSLDVIGAAANGADAIETICDLEPDVCVLDFHLPDMTGAEVMDAVLSDGVQTSVLVLSGSADHDAVYEMIEAGAAGFQRKTATADEICDAIERAARGETVLPADEVSAIAEQIRSRRDDTRPALSEREVGLLNSIAEGHSASEIASRFNLAESTVKTHLTRIYDKLGVSERAAAVAQALRLGLIE